MILITGANGLVGSYLCRYLLQQGKQVRALKRANSDLRLVADIKDRIEWVEGDVTDVMALEEAMQGIDTIYHCAGFISYKKENADTLMRINAQGTANVVNLALDLRVKKLLHVSSISALGRTGKNGETIREDAPWNMKHLTTQYAHSKFVAEREVWRGIAEGLNAVIINPSIIIGAGNWDSGSSKLFTTVYNGFKYYTEGVTGYVDVRDVVKAAYQLMESDISGERFILNGENIMYRDVLQSMAKALHVQGPTRRAGKFLSGIAWRVEWLKSLFSGSEPTVTKQTARIANRSVYYNSDKIISTLNFTFTPLTQTITDTATSFLSEKKDNHFHPLQF